MFENLFIASKENIEKEIVLVNVNFKFSIIEDHEKQKLGYFFYYNKKNRILYYAKIASIYQIANREVLKESINGSVCGIQFKNGYLQISFEESLLEATEELLKNLYAKSNKGMMRDRNFSIYHTFRMENFCYALPVIDWELFEQQNPFLDIILPEYSIIPEVLGESKNFAQIIDEDGQLFLSLTNQKMLKVDNEYLLQEQYRELYRPYFYEFYLNQHAQQLLKNNEYKLEQLYEIEIISKKNVRKYQNENETILEGTLLFSASPLKQIPAYIKILHENKDQTIQAQFNEIENFLQNEIVTTQNKDEIEQSFMKEIPLVNNMKVNYSVDINNVGQANWIQIFVQDTQKNTLASIVYDIGIGHCADVNLRKQITEKAANDIHSNNLFVLSHWDMDHIQGIIELQRQQFHTTWIMPNLPAKSSNGAKRLAAFLSIDPNIDATFVDHCLNGQVIFKNQYFMLGKGKGNGPNRDTSYTINNNLGLILVIKTATQKMLFPGDCDYSQFPEAFYQDYDAMVISHHGAKIKQSDLNAFGFPSSNTNKFAVSCVGKSKKYPAKCHKNTIESLGFKVEETRKFTDVNNPCKKILT